MKAFALRLGLADSTPSPCWEKTFIISALRVAVSPGHWSWWHLSACMLQTTALGVAPSMTRLFNLSLTTGNLPLEWRQSHVVPIPKSENRSSPSGYRPISLLSILSKLLEKHNIHVYQNVLSNAKTNQLIPPNQWGFLARRSTETALIKLTSDWFDELASGSVRMCGVLWSPDGIRFSSSPSVTP